jgi:hypothetical protein
MFEKHIGQSISNIFVTYFYYTKVFQILHLTYYKPNGSIDVFKMKHKKLSNLFSYFYVKNRHIIFKYNFRLTYFLV